MLRQQNKKPKGWNQLARVAANNYDDLVVDDIEDLDEHTVREIFMDAGLLKDKTNERKKAKMYFGVKCQNSFYVFEKGNKFRGQGCIIKTIGGKENKVNFKTVDLKNFDKVQNSLIGQTYGDLDVLCTTPYDHTLWSAFSSKLLFESRQTMIHQKDTKS